MPKPRGNDPDHLVGKLQKAGRDDLLHAVGTGAVSPYGASVSAGLRARKPGGADISSRRKRLLRARLRALGLDEQLTGGQIQELWLGPGGEGSAFRDNKSRHRAWRQNRAFFMSNDGDGRRCWGFWRYELGLLPPGGDEEAALLYELGELTLVEKAELVPRWRAKFDHAATLRGFAAICDFLDQAALPRSLFYRWNAERRARKHNAEAAE
jgi:hypothetical protein